MYCDLQREHPEAEENYFEIAKQSLPILDKNYREIADDDGKNYDDSIFVLMSFIPIEAIKRRYKLPTREDFEQIVSDHGRDS